MQKNRTLLASAFLALALGACSGGGATVGASHSGGGSSPTTAPTGGTTVKPSTGPSTAPTPTATPTTGSQGNAVAPPTAPPDAPGVTNTVPAVPTSGCRAGQTYDVSVQSGPTVLSSTGAVEVFTVFEPDSLCAGQTYPLIFWGPGFGGSRESTAGSYESYTGKGYAVISVDEAGEGNDGGKIRVMDPDQEGQMLLAVMNWAQAKLTWLSYGPTNDGKDPHEPIFGSMSGSYGGMYQFMLLNIDTRHRLRAIVPQITPADLNFSLFPGGAIKSLWDTELFADGQTAGNGTSRANFDPYVNNAFANDLAANAEDTGFHDYLAYHSADYFCNGTSVATNGGPGTAPWLPPTTAPPKINALIWIGVRDTLFDFNNGYNNFKCMQRGGGDVRLLSYQTGHNAQVESNVPVGTVPDPYVALFYPNNDSLDSKCGTLAESDAELAWFNQYLKGQAGAANIIPTGPCISFEAGDGISLPTIPTYTTGPAETPYDIGSLTLTSGVSLAGLVPNASTTLFTAPTGGAVIAGIPHIVFDVAPALGVTATDSIIYVGYGVMHASNPGIWDLVDNQVMPIRGTGHFDEDLVGGGIRLLAGDQVGLLIFGLNTQFTSDVVSTTPVQSLVTVTGKVYMPVLPNIASNV